MKGNFEIRRAEPSEYTELMAMLDEVFGFPSERTQGFSELLPKLYKKEYSPCENNLVMFLDGKPVGAVGMYERTLIVGDETLKSVGIGNVACRKEFRGSGIMTELMKKAVSEIISSGAQLSDLGGKRHRYAHFGYECAGRVYNFEVSKDSVKHMGKENMPDDLVCVPIEEYLNDAELLYSKKTCRADRSGKFADIIFSWCAKPVAILRNGEFCGYAVVNGDKIGEISLCDPKDLGGAIRALLEICGGNIIVSIHETEADIMREIYGLFDGFKICSNEQISVIKHRETAFAYLKYLNSEKKLPDGKLSLYVHGIGGDESFTLFVQNGTVGVRDVDRSDGIPIELMQTEAVSFLYGSYSPKRSSLDTAVESWLPLPLYFSSPDTV